MGILDFFKRMVDPEALGDQCIAVQEKVYGQAAAINPTADPHELLAQVWLTRMAFRRTNLKSEEKQLAAYAATMQFACIPAPDNARALGIDFLNQERPDIYNQVPKFRQELERIMGLVLAVGEGPEFERMYRRLNPNMGMHA